MMNREAGWRREGAKRIVMAAWMLHELRFGRYSLGTKPCVFPCKVAPAGDDRYLGCAAVAAAVVLMFFFLPQWNCGFKLLWLRFCVRSSSFMWNLGLQIAVEWLHNCFVMLCCMCVERGGSWSREGA